MGRGRKEKIVSKINIRHGRTGFSFARPSYSCVHSAANDLYRFARITIRSGVHAAAAASTTSPTDGNDV